MLEINDLFVKGQDEKELLHGIQFSIKKGEKIALTGASGSGKTTLIRAITGISDDSSKVTNGSIILDGKNLLELSDKERRKLCGRTFGFIPQSPMTSFFPNSKIGKQMIETFCVKLNKTKAEAAELAKSVLRQVNLDQCDRVLNSYPSELSGGMLQRVTVAIIIGTQPSYIFADEPTSALDAENKKILIELLKSFSRAAIIFISHDYDAIKELCQTTCIFEQGRIIEKQETRDLFEKPLETWTKTFVDAVKKQKEELTKWKAL